MICGIARPLHAREITLRISESCIENQNTINHILLSLKCYIYIGVDVREKSHTYTVQYLKCYIKVEKNSTFYIFPKQTEEIYKLNGLMLRRQ
jgi:hypothetical protein